MIKVDNHDFKQCCNEIFKLWLQRSSSPKWEELIHALKNIKLNAVAAEISMAMCGMYINVGMKH